MVTPLATPRARHAARPRYRRCRPSTWPRCGSESASTSMTRTGRHASPRGRPPIDLVQDLDVAHHAGDDRSPRPGAARPRYRRCRPSTWPRCGSESASTSMTRTGRHASPRGRPPIDLVQDLDVAHHAGDDRSPRPGAARPRYRRCRPSTWPRCGSESASTSMTRTGRHASPRGRLSIDLVQDLDVWSHLWRRRVPDTPPGRGTVGAGPRRGRGVEVNPLPLP